MVWFDGIIIFMFCYYWWLCTAVNISVQYNRRYFQHAQFIPIVGVGKRGEY